MSERHTFLVSITVPDGTRLEATRRELLTSIGFGQPEIQIMYGLSGPINDDERMLKSMMHEIDRVNVELPEHRHAP